MYLRERFDTLNELLECLEQNGRGALIPMFTHAYEHEIEYHSQGKEAMATFWDGNLHVLGPGSMQELTGAIMDLAQPGPVHILFYKMNAAEDYFITGVPTMPEPKRDM